LNELDIHASCFLNVEALVGIHLQGGLRVLNLSADVGGLLSETLLDTAVVHFVRFGVETGFVFVDVVRLKHLPSRIQMPI